MAENGGNMATRDRKLAAHLARRAGFGATPDELDYYESLAYEDLVDHFLDRESLDHVTDDLIYNGTTPLFVD